MYLTLLKYSLLSYLLNNIYIYNHETLTKIPKQFTIVPLNQSTKHIYMITKFYQVKFQI